jgi:hypothetical protein
MKKYRIIFGQEIKDNIAYFADVHRYDKIKDFREAWDEFVDEHSELFQSEYLFQSRKNDELSYREMLQKLFTSARYYHRKTKTKTKDNKACGIRDESETKSETNKGDGSRGCYKMASKELTLCMDEFITHESKVGREKPSAAWTWFMGVHQETLEREIERWSMNDDEAWAKMKKTFKNRFYRSRIKGVKNTN